MNAMKRILPAGVFATLSSWLRNTRASVSVEFVAGAVLLLTMTMGTLDVYRLMDASSLSANAAKTMADYMWLSNSPKSQHLEDLAKYAHRKQIAVPSHAAFVVSAFTQPAGAGASPDKSWDHRILVAPDGETPSPLAEVCGSRSLIGTGGGLPAGFTMAAGEEIIVVEVCVKVSSGALLSGGVLDTVGLPSVFYEYRIVPVRDFMPAKPV